MKIGRYQFAPPWWGWLLFLIAVLVFCALGVWQINRAQYKEQLQQKAQAARAAGLQMMSASAAAASAAGESSQLVHGRRYIVTGHYDEAHQILLNDQTKGHQLGYRVWTPLVLGNGVRVMVDRGWIPRPDEAAKRPPDPSVPDGVVRVKGIWSEFPQPGLEFGTDPHDCNGSNWPRTMNMPKAEVVACQYDSPVAHGLLLLDPSAPGGFVRDWDQDRVSLSPFVHYLYASQWFLGAILAGVILVVTNLKRRKRPSS